ncbi:GID complex subunit containing RING finger motif [Didymella pomorum]|uniref:GID complex subunit containing RING finger motif n=1 Tax=Didymella pomorum TaxID=749634 RepID=A0A9W8Z6I1_9PLEO|nr:GID complex subunit containing RING finger motif [Didymella pomorum]
MKCILISDGVQSSTIGSMLQTLKAVEGKLVESLLQQVVGLLSSKAKNGGKILVCITSLSEASDDTPRLSSEPIESAQRHNIPAAVIEVMVAGWMQNLTVSGETKDSISLLAGLLGIKVFHFDILPATLVSAATFWQKIEDDLIQEEARLVALRKALKTKDPKGTTLLLQKIGVPDTTELDEEMMKLPAGVKDLVERLSDNEVELTFSIAAFTQLQRAAMGVPEGANALMLQLSLDYNNKSSPSFCLHYDTDKHFETLTHTRYVCSAGSESPTKQICTSAQTALTWQLSRMIYSAIRIGAPGIASIVQDVNAWLPKLAQLCVSCSARNAQSTQLRRSTPCTSNPYACAQLWYNLPLHVRIPEIRTDTFSVDMALASVYAAAMANKPELLPNCPIRGNEYIKSILDALPTMSVMRDAVNLSSVLASYHAHAEKLISWAVVHHRGFLATATGLLKIPNLPPGTHQFVLANASPKLENVFVQRTGNSKRDTTVLFHGTSLDRLPAILAQGLRFLLQFPEFELEEQWAV